MTPEQKEKILNAFKRPFRYDTYGQMIFDANDHPMIDIRGWGYLQYRDAGDGAEIQDSIGNYVTKKLNEL